MNSECSAAAKALGPGVLAVDRSFLRSSANKLVILMGVVFFLQDFPRTMQHAAFCLAPRRSREASEMTAVTDIFCTVAPLEAESGQQGSAAPNLRAVADPYPKETCTSSGSLMVSTLQSFRRSSFDLRSSP